MFSGVSLTAGLYRAVVELEQSLIDNEIDGADETKLEQAKARLPQRVERRKAIPVCCCYYLVIDCSRPSVGIDTRGGDAICGRG